MTRIAMMVLLLLAALPARAAGEMTVTFLEGSARAGDRALRQGDALESGETVETAAGGRLEIRLASGTVIRLGEGSRLTLSPEPARRSFSARLALGNLWTRVHKLVAGETFAIETENGVAGVRGTEFRLETGQSEDLLRVYEGAVEVKGAAGWTSRVERGRELSFARDRTPGEAKAFDAASEKSHRFMRWVHERTGQEREEEGRPKAQPPKQRLEKERPEKERREKRR